MTSLGAGVTTEAPTLLVVADLGDIVPFGAVREYTEALDDVRRVAEALVALQRNRSFRRPRAPGGSSPVLNIVKAMRLASGRGPGHYGTLRVARMRLESPFEVVLTTVANQYSPIAFGVTGIVIVERLVRLVMEWQKHRLEIFQGMDGARASLGGPHHEEAADSIARQVIEPIHRRETWQPEVSDDEIEEAVQSAAGPINRLSRFQLTRVTSSNTGERE